MIFFGFKYIASYLSRSSQIYESRSGVSTSSDAGFSSSGSSQQQSAQKLFDVYITYSLKDSEFVHQNLAPTLEHGSTSHRLCLHHRDFPTTAPTYDTVTVAADSSSRTLVVMSKAYLEQEWPRVKAPLKNQLMRNDNYKDSLVFLFLEDVNVSVSDLELAHYLSICPTVRWGAPGFLNQLRFFLPEPAVLTFQRNITLRSLHNTPAVSPKHQHQSKQQQQQVFTASNKDMSILHARLVHPSMPSVAPSSVYSRGSSEHTYHSIPDNHIYHTLEPMPLKQHRVPPPPPPAHPRNRNLDLVLRVEPPRNSLSPAMPTVCHAYTHSTSSGQQLLSSNDHTDHEEYIV